MLIDKQVKYCQIMIINKVCKRGDQHKAINNKSARLNIRGAEKHAIECGANIFNANGQQISTLCKIGHKTQNIHCPKTEGSPK